MKIDRKIFYISLFLLLFFSACFYLFIPDFVSKTFDSLEQNSVVEESGKMRYFIIQEVSRLDSINLEWSKREDLYKFFSKSTDDQDIFVSNDFDFQYLKDSKIDYLALINNNGELLYNIEINNGLVQSGISNDFLGGLCGSAVLKNCTGLISWQGDKIAAISIRPVSKGDDFFPIGHIVMLRFFDEKVTTYDGKEFILKKIIDVDKKVEDSESVLFVDKVDANMLNIYSFYDDVLGKRSFYSKIPMERTIYKSEKLIMGVISYSVLILQLLMIISFLFIIKRMIVERLNLLVFSIQSILKSKKREKTIIFNGNDEISLLSREISNTFIRVNNLKHSSQEKQDDLDLTIKSMHDIIIVFNRDNKILFSHFPENKKVEMRKMEEKAFLSNDFSLKVINLIDDLKDNGNTFDFEYPIIKNGRKYWYDVNISVKNDFNNQFDGVIVVIRDITSSKKMQKEMEEKIIELQKLNKLMIGRELKMVELKEIIKKMKKDE